MCADLQSVEQMATEAIRQARKNAGMTQAELAAEARKCGLDWTQATVAGLETQRRHLALGEFLLLSALLDVPLAELFPKRGKVRLGRVEVSTGYVRDVLSGKQGTRARLAPKASPEWRAAGQDAERYAARTLGVEPETVAKVAQDLWGRSLTEKRERRLREQASDEAHHDRLAGLRGHVTRGLMDELRQAIGRGAPRASSTRKGKQ